MTRCAVSILLIVTLFVGETKACDCLPNTKVFLENIHPSCKLVGLIKVIRYSNYYDSSKAAPLSMEVELIEAYKGNESRKIITIWGSNGYNCGAPITWFKEGHYYVMALYSVTTEVGDHNIDYEISNCSEYWLSVDFKKLTARGEGKRGGQTEKISLAVLKSKVQKNGH